MAAVEALAYAEHDLRNARAQHGRLTELAGVMHQHDEINNYGALITASMRGRR